MDFIETNILMDALSGGETTAKERIRLMLRNEREGLTRACWRVCDWIAEVEEEEETEAEKR